MDYLDYNEEVVAKTTAQRFSSSGYNCQEPKDLSNREYGGGP